MEKLSHSKCEREGPRRVRSKRRFQRGLNRRVRNWRDSVVLVILAEVWLTYYSNVPHVGNRPQIVFVIWRSAKRMQP